ncbi:hypothetical protein [Actinoplanes sp. L3-i22]|uniref:hypothetical protein n=1 Tax=Actinoplanes sp. L3-i22 TaxID=2836373 RepID=UPI001C74CC32|nr:hypothetical protein [Actinoplanes sp. L3-i22]BCY12168.1 hypothetical protein L3i22_072560 [Actinoplanes sp. L3-i22]
MGGVRTPLQGGLPPAGVVAGAVVEIACDESGFSGTNLLHSGAPLITHAGVDLTRAEATALIAGLRDGFRFSPRELKSGQLLRKPGAALDFFLAALRGRAHVHVIDKERFLIGRVVDLLLAEPSYAAGTSLARDPRAAALATCPAGPERDAFLAAFVDLARTKRARPIGHRVDNFFQTRDSLVRGTPADPVLDALDPTHVRAVVTRLDAEDRALPPPLEPLLPALAETVLFWAAGTRRVLVTHDEQSALTADRLTRLQRALATGPGPSPLAGLVMADSRADPRVQVADLLAGVARRSVPDALVTAQLMAPEAVGQREQRDADQR